jgi:hypothetical protein
MHHLPSSLRNSFNACMFCRRQRERKLDVFFSTKKAQDGRRAMVGGEGPYQVFLRYRLLQFSNQLISSLFQQSREKSPTQGGRSPPCFFCTRSYAELRKSHSHSLHICPISAALIAAANSFCRPANTDSPCCCRRQLPPPVTAAANIRRRLLPS